MSVNELAAVVSISLGGILGLLTVIGAVLDHKLDKLINLLEREK